MESLILIPTTICHVIRSLLCCFACIQRTLLGAIFDQFKSVNGKNIIEFLKKVRSTYAPMEIIHIVLDDAGYHRSKEVVEALEKLEFR